MRVPGACTETEARGENCVFVGRDVSLQRCGQEAHEAHGAPTAATLLRNMVGQIIQG